MSKYLRKIFKSMPSNLIQKLVRKKYFDINGKRAKGDEILNTDLNLEKQKEKMEDKESHEHHG